MIQHLDPEGQIGDRGHRGGPLLFEVMAAGDPRRVRVELDPIAGPGRSTEEDLEAPVGIDVELCVVEDPGSPLRECALHTACFDRERDVDGAGGATGHAVGELRSDGRIEVDGVRVVAEALSGGRDDLPEHRLARIVLEVADQAAFEQVPEYPQAPRYVVGHDEAPFGSAEPVGRILECGDQPIECLTGLALCVAHSLKLGRGRPFGAPEMTTRSGNQEKVAEATRR